MKSRIVQAILLILLCLAGVAFFSSDSDSGTPPAATSGPTP